MPRPAQKPSMARTVAETLEASIVLSEQVSAAAVQSEPFLFRGKDILNNCLELVFSYVLNWKNQANVKAASALLV